MFKIIIFDLTSYVIKLLTYTLCPFNFDNFILKKVGFFKKVKNIFNF